jgi:predicted lactoylglutathione lyase
MKLKKFLCILIAVLMMLSLSACSDSVTDDAGETSAEDGTNPTEECICEDFCSGCKGCLYVEICTCPVCPGGCACPPTPEPLDFEIDVLDKWEILDKDGLLQIGREDDEGEVRAALGVFSMKIESMLEVLKGDVYKEFDVEKAKDMSIEEFLKEVGKSREEFAKDLVDSGREEALELISSKEADEIDGMYAFKTHMEFTITSGDDEIEGSNIVYTIFGENKIYKVIYNGMRVKDYIDEFEEMAKTFKIVEID